MRFKRLNEAIIFRKEVAKAEIEIEKKIQTFKDLYPYSLRKEILSNLFDEYNSNNTKIRGLPDEWFDRAAFKSHDRIMELYKCLGKISEFVFYDPRKDLFKITSSKSKFKTKYIKYLGVL